MKVYIQKGFDNECLNINGFAALHGFKEMGWEICFFQNPRELSGNELENVVVGGIGTVKEALIKLGVPLPPELNYPDELQSLLGRKIWKSTINTIAHNPELWNVFVKPTQASKKFTGVVVRSTTDLIGCGDQFGDVEVWCSEPVNFVAEWRCFVRYGEVLDVRMYRGDWRKHFDYKVIEEAIRLYQTAPKAYGIDFGLTDKGETLLVEVNDGHSLGSYGLVPLSYAKLLSARWAEITKSRDYCDF